MSDQESFQTKRQQPTPAPLPQQPNKTTMTTPSSGGMKLLSDIVAKVRPQFLVASFEETRVSVDW